ncbi:hypothetical protein [Candidatus Pelagibacter bacterium nBUS_32]|uniref:hypothetical protein n=1 Tax=Candidatus Pelagibacter bacterium nBUS_32 TaxID=3374192 RepID=UPI003EB85187
MLKKILIITSCAFFLLLLIDFSIGSYLLKLTPKKINATTAHKFYDHDLKKNFKARLEWTPGKTYIFCTDHNSFRNFCQNNNSNLKEFDIAFIGDSFTEGVGLEYKDTFVGKITNQLNHLDIANLGVVSYSPSIYFSKLKYLLNKGYKFKRVVIYFDISDVYDDNRKYHLINDRVTRKKSLVLSNIQKFLKSSFPFLSYSTKIFKNDFLAKIFREKKIINKCNFLDYCHEKSSWTFNDKYFGKNEIQKSLNIMEMTYKLLQKNNIKMSVGIYPWPSQIMHDDINSKIVELIKDFCLDKCEFLFNNFPDFFHELDENDKFSLISKYYINDDVHFNSLGNHKIFMNFINTFKY